MNVNNVRTLMNQIIAAAQDAITELDKEQTDNNEVMNICIEQMGDLMQDVENEVFAEQLSACNNIDCTASAHELI